jgi:hypothetical protein
MSVPFTVALLSSKRVVLIKRFGIFEFRYKTPPRPPTHSKKIHRSIFKFNVEDDKQSSLTAITPP